MGEGFIPILKIQSFGEILSVRVEFGYLVLENEKKTGRNREESVHVSIAEKEMRVFTIALARAPFQYPGRDLNPHNLLGLQDFKSCVSTNFTTRASICISAF